MTSSSDALKATMTMVDLGSASEEIEPQPLEGGSGELTAAQAPPSNLDATIETELPPEWSVGRMRIARATPIAPDIRAGAGTSQGIGVGAGTSDGVYDPYAGAAPDRRRNEGWGVRRSNVSADSRTDGIDQVAFDLWVQELRRLLPRARGTVLLTISVRGDGSINTAKVIGGSAPPKVKFFVRDAVIGKKLGEETVDSHTLPLIEIG